MLSIDNMIDNMIDNTIDNVTMVAPRGSGAWLFQFPNQSSVKPPVIGGNTTVVFIGEHNVISPLTRSTVLSLSNAAVWTSSTSVFIQSCVPATQAAIKGYIGPGSIPLDQVSVGSCSISCWDPIITLNTTGDFTFDCPESFGHNFTIVVDLSAVPFNALESFHLRLKSAFRSLSVSGGGAGSITITLHSRPVDALSAFWFAYSPSAPWVDVNLSHPVLSFALEFAEYETFRFSGATGSNVASVIFVELRNITDGLIKFCRGSVLEAATESSIVAVSATRLASLSVVFAMGSRVSAHDAFGVGTTVIGVFTSDATANAFDQLQLSFEPGTSVSVSASNASLPTLVVPSRLIAIQFDLTAGGFLTLDVDTCRLDISGTNVSLVGPGATLVFIDATVYIKSAFGLHVNGSMIGFAEASIQSSGLLILDSIFPGGPARDANSVVQFTNSTIYAAANDTADSITVVQLGLVATVYVLFSGNVTIVGSPRFVAPLLVVSVDSVRSTASIESGGGVASSVLRLLHAIWVFCGWEYDNTTVAVNLYSKSELELTDRSTLLEVSHVSFACVTNAAHLVLAVLIDTGSLAHIFNQSRVMSVVCPSDVRAASSVDPAWIIDGSSVTVKGRSAIIADASGGPTAEGSSVLSGNSWCATVRPSCLWTMQR